MADVAARAANLLTGEGIRRILGFLSSSQTPEGAFCDRGGRADLYYTVFGLGVSVALGGDASRDPALRRYMDTRPPARTLGFIDLVSLLRCRRYLAADGGEPQGRARLDELAALQAYRSRDGGYAHERRHAPAGTMYGGFLSEQGFRDANRPWDAAAWLDDGLSRLASGDGGFANHPGARHGVAAATASALVLRARHGGMDAKGETCAAAFLERLRDPGGGYRSTRNAPGADLLSTACVRYAQAACGMRASPEALRADGGWIESLWSDAGGFRGCAADPQPDVEYTWYALLTLGALAHLRTTDTG